MQKPDIRYSEVGLWGGLNNIIGIEFAVLNSVGLKRMAERDRPTCPQLLLHDTFAFGDLLKKSWPRTYSLPSYMMLIKSFNVVLPKQLQVGFKIQKTLSRLILKLIIM